MAARRCVVILAVGAVALAAPAAVQGASSLRLITKRAHFLHSDGERYAAYGRRGTGVLHVIDTVRRNRFQFRHDPDCELWAEHPRMTAAGRALLICDDRQSSRLLDLATGTSEVVSQPSFDGRRSVAFVSAGRHWLVSDDIGPCGSASRCSAYLNWRTGERRVVAAEWWERSPALNLDDPELRPVCDPRESPPALNRGRFYTDLEPYIVRYGRTVRLVGCDGARTVLDRRAGPAFLAGGFISWGKRGGRAGGYEISRRRHHRWQLPGRNPLTVEAVHTRERVFVSRAREIDQRFGVATRIAIYSAMR